MFLGVTALLASISFAQSHQPGGPMENLPSAKQRARIFISYKRNIEPDEPVATAVYEALSKHYDVFIDRTMLVGAPWAKQIDEEIARADFLITFLSENAIQSEMVLAEIETAHRLGKESNGSPKILPVRLAYHAPFQYPLSAYLNPINWANWENHRDTPNLIVELMRAISGSELAHSGQAKIQAPSSRPALTAPLPSAQPLCLDMPEGTISPDSKFYVERLTDLVALNAIKRQGGVTFTIKGPRQMGKSSLLIRTIEAAVNAGKRVVYLDFQIFDKAALANADVFFRQFCFWLSDELDLEDKTGKYWGLDIGNPMRCERYLSKYLLKELGCPLVLALDEVESIFETDFRTDFFSMLRAWHNNRAKERVWRLLDLALVTSTEPYQLIDNLNQSPFNVGEMIELKDFTPEQVADLNRRHGSPLNTEQRNKLMELLNGHPYLVRRALYLISGGRTSFDELLVNAANDRGPFGDHLRYHLFRLYGKDDLIQGLRQIIRHHSCNDEKVFFRLQGAGLVTREGGSELPRCRLYTDYFQEYLHV
jgi:hypothetical protein